MGLFGSRKKTYVASVTYNLLGDKKPRNLNKDMVLNSIINPPADYITYIRDYGLTGMGMNFIKYMKWARRSNYVNLIGLATSEYIDASLLSNEEAIPLVREYLNWPVDRSLDVKSTQFGIYSYFSYAENWIINNRPDQYEKDYALEEFTVVDHYEWDYVEVPDEGNNRRLELVRVPVYRSDIKITFEDGSVQTLNTSEVDKNARYVFIVYFERITDPVAEVTTIQYGSIYYKEGSGFTKFDDLFKEIIKQDYTYPAFIPLRTWKNFVSDKYLPEVHEMNFKAVKKALGKDYYEELMETIADNKDISDIDFAYLFFGIPLNTTMRDGRRYIFELLKNFFESSQLGRSFFGKHIFWRAPKHIRIWSKFGSINYDVWLEWGGLNYELTQGVWENTKPRDYWFGMTWEAYEEEDDAGETYTVWLEKFTMVHQMSDKRYERLDVYNFAHGNYVYGGKSVINSVEDVDFSPDADPSAFVIPIQINTLRQISLLRANQIMQLANNIMFNCYKVVKKKWYQTGIFQIVVIIVAIIIVIVTWGGGSQVSAGMTSASLGAQAATAAGLTGMAATIVAAIVNVVAAMIVVQAITMVATMLFGAKVGAIIGFVASIFVGMGMSSGSFANMGEQLLSLTHSAAGLITIASSLLNLSALITQLKIGDIAKASERYFQQYEEQMETVNNAYKELVGDSIGNAEFFLNILNSANQNLNEPPEMFLSRTLSTGSDIVDLTLNSVYGYTDITLSLDLT